MRKVWYGGWIFLASFLIMLALVFSGIRLMLPLATEYKNNIETLISELLHQPVQVERIDTDWLWFKPRLKLINVKLLDPAAGSEIFSAQEVILALNPFSSAWSGRFEIDEVTVVRTHLSLTRDAAGLIYAQGFVLP
ncbi:MAG TPA: AsmA family protein, partial [Gammaproteobacteria bacterium]